MGNTNPVSHQRYLLIGNTIHLIKDRFPHHLLASATEFAALEIVPAGRQLEAITTPDWSISRGEHGNLRLEPSQDGLSMDDLNRKVELWQHALATSVIPLQQAESHGEIQLITKDDPEPLHFKLVTIEGETLLWRPKPGLAYRLPTATTLLSPPVGMETP
jgi:uncharacterized protein (DUF2249 family)